MWAGAGRWIIPRKDVINADRREPSDANRHGRTDVLFAHPNMPKGVPREAQTIGQRLPAAALHAQVAKGDKDVRLLDGRQVDHASTVAASGDCAAKVGSIPSSCIA